MKKVISLIVLTGVLTLTFVTSGFGASQWLVKSKGNRQHTLWLDGTITKGDPKTTFHKEENAGHKNVKYDLDISDWSIAAYGGSNHTSYFVNYKEPDGNLRVIVYYDWISMTVVSVSQMVYADSYGGYTYESVPVESVKTAEYCFGSYGCLGG